MISDLYAVDKVGNVSDPVIVSVDNDSSAPDISSAQIGINATGVGTYENDEQNKLETVYYNKNIDITIVAKDKNLSDFSVTVKKGNENIGGKYKKESNGSSFRFNANTTLDDGNVSEYDINVSASDGVNLAEKKYKVIIDTENPSGISAEVKPVNVKDDDDIFSDYGEKYTALNTPKIAWSYEDKNPCKVELVEKGIADPYIGSDIGGELKLKDEFYDKEKIEIKFTDKAGNSVTKTISRKDGEKISEANNICYVNNKFSFGNFDMTDTGVNSTSGHKTLEVDDKNKFTGTIGFTKTGNVNSNFLKVYAINGTESIDITKYADVKKDEIDVSIPKDELIDDDYKFVAYYYDIADGEVDKVESATYTVDTTAPELKGKYEIEENGKNGYVLTYTYTLTEKNPNFGKFTCSVKNELMSSGKNNTETLKPKMYIGSTEVENGFESLQSALADSKNWVKDGTSDQYTATVKIMTEGIYNMYLQVDGYGR